MRNELSKPIHDTVICKVYLDIGYVFEQINTDSAIYYYEKSYNHAKAKGLKLQKANALRYLGIVYRIQGLYDKALSCYEMALKIGEEINDQRTIAASYNSLGLLYYNQGIFEKALEYFLPVINIEEVQKNKRLLTIIHNNIGISYDNIGLFDKAIEHHLKSLKIREEMGDKAGIAASLTNIGSIHHNQRNQQEALKYYSQALEIYLEINDKRGLARSYNNVALVYRNTNQLEDAKKFHLKAIEIREELNDKRGLFISYNNLGSVMRQMGELEKALDYFNEAIRISEELGDKHRMSIIYNSTSNLYLNLAKNSEGAERYKYLQTALQYSERSFELARETGSMPRKSYAANILRVVYTNLENYEEAIRYAEIHIELSDSIYNMEKAQAVADAEKKFQAEKKQLQIDKLEKEKALQYNEILRQKEVGRMQLIIIICVIVGLLAILIMLVFVLHRLKITKKQKAIIEEQKLLVEEKNVILNERNEEIRAQHDEIEHQRDEIIAQRDMVLKQKEHIMVQKNHITNSISYAKLIQNAVLPSDAFVDSILGEHFILFFPKDIVSGDFYWASKLNNKLVFAVADCTGHGVPGAFMSMLGLSFLKEIIVKQGITNPAKVLENLRESIIDALQQKGKPTDQREGLDIAFCVLDTNDNKLQYAGANSPLIIVKSNKELNVIKPDKQPVAYHRKMKPFTNKEVLLSKGDCVYLASDGYQNQLGGENYKMFMSKNFHKLLLQISDEPMHVQNELLYENFIKWKEPHEQVDDVTVLGLMI